VAGRIVVGVDGSAGSLAALRWAVDEAARRGDGVEAVHAWHEPYLVAAGGYALPVMAVDDLRATAEGTLEGAVRDATAEHPDVPVERLVVEGRAATVLLDVATGADLLVVGSRGHGGFAGLLLGSVSQQCAHHAPCPLVIVPAPS
jgi:nucleotide-binding universal stress UspA family protein